MQYWCLCRNVDIFHNIPIAYYEAPYEMSCYFIYNCRVSFLCLPAGCDS